MFKDHYDWLTEVAPFWINLCNTFNKFGYKIEDFINEDSHIFFEERTPDSKEKQSYLQFLTVVFMHKYNCLRDKQNWRSFP